MYLPDREWGFPRVINDMEYKIGIEIGVRDGLYSKWLLEKTNLEKLYSVDLFPGLDIMENARNKLRAFGDRSVLIRDSSVDFAKKCDDKFFDFIYIDAGHSYSDVMSDIVAWWPKLKSGGMISGDDYSYVTNPSEGTYGTVDAVDVFCKNHGILYHVTGASNSTTLEKHRHAKGMGKIIEAALNRRITIQFGVDYLADDIRIPNWFFFKE